MGRAWSPSAIPVVCDLGNRVPCPEAPLSILLGHSPRPRPLKLSCGLNPLSQPDLTPVCLPFPEAPAGEAVWFPCRLPLHITTEEVPLGSWQGAKSAAGGSVSGLGKAHGGSPVCGTMLSA